MKDDPFAGMPKHPDPNYMWISPSQDETFERCGRLWKFESCVKVPRIVKGDALFGTVIHSVIERYQLADDLGRVPELHLVADPLTPAARTNARGGCQYLPSGVGHRRGADDPDLAEGPHPRADRQGA